MRQVGIDALWINAHDAALTADQKLVQLNAAKAVGLEIPKTLFSNTPAHARDWVDRQPSIYKSFFPATWKSKSGSLRSNFTAKVNSQQLTDDIALRGCAGIFQQEILKAFEIRATFFGTVCLAAKIDSQHADKTQTDWRTGFIGESHNLIVEPFELPTTIRTKCFALLRVLGLEFACIDLAVTQTGEYVFFELNEMGQFLWVEQYCPEIKMLDSFLRYICITAKSTLAAQTKIDLDSVVNDEAFQSFFKIRCENGNAHHTGMFIFDEEE
jgi:hypothetical protein